MSKRFVVFTILLAFVLSGAFATLSDYSFMGVPKHEIKQSVSFKVSPYSFQYVKYGPGFPSKYSFGAEVGYRYNIFNGLTVGADVKYQNYMFKSLSSSVHIISVMPKVGWTQQLKNNWSLSANFGAGPQLKLYKSVKALNLALNLYLGGGYTISERFALNAGVELGLALQKNSLDFSADAMLGCAIMF